MLIRVDESAESIGSLTVFGKREREKEVFLNGVRTYLPDTVLQGCRLFKQCWNLPAGTVLQECRLLKWCWNLPAGHCVAVVQAV